MVKKLYRVEEGKMFCGVCGGLAEYFNIDPTIVRLGFALLGCMAFSGVVAYFVAAAIMPPKSSVM